MKRRVRIASSYRGHSWRAGRAKRGGALVRVGSLTDLKSRELAQKEIRQHNERLQILSDCLAQLLSQRDAEKIVSDIFSRVAAHVGADAFFNYLLAPKLHLLSLGGVSPGNVCDICNACSGGAIRCMAAKNRTTVVANDIQQSTTPEFSQVRALGVQSYLCVPLLVGKHLLGVLSFASRSKAHFETDEIEFLQLISGYVAIAIDRAKSEDLLRGGEQRLQLALAAANMGTWELDLGGRLNGVFTDEELIKSFNASRASPQVEQMMGLGLGEYRDFRDWNNHLHPDDRQRSFDALRSAIVGERPYDTEHRFVWPDGSIHWVHCRGTLFRDNNGTPQRFIGVSLDITARKQAEEDIRQRNERLQFISNCLAQLLAERNPDHIVANLFSQVALHVGADACFNFHVDSEKRDEIVLHVSLGISKEIEQKLRRLRFGEGPCGMVAQTRSVLVANDIQHSNDPTVAFLRELGFQCYVGFPLMVGDYLLGTLDFAAKGKAEFTPEERNFLHLVSGYVAIAMERAESEQALVRSKESAEKANRTKDLFIATLSHELRTPLTPALMTATSLEQDDSLASGLRDQMRVIRRSIELEARLIDDLLDLTRIERGKFLLRPKNVNIQELLVRALDFVHEDISVKQLDLTTDITAQRTITKGDPSRLQQVLWNLLKNSTKFTPSGGTIHIRIFNPNPQVLVVEIRDSGMGIAQENLEKIFNPFEQCATGGDHRYGGLGLGLAISKSIVELHGGTITAESEGIDHGATFTIRLPVAGTAKQTSARPKLIHQQRAPGKLHILLVEDHEQTRTVLARLLRREGHEVQTAGTCAEALQIAHTPTGTSPFEVLVSDIGLPDGSGLTLVRQLKAESPSLTAIALSGYGTHEDVDRSMQAGFNAHLTKPIGIEDLRHALAA